MPHKSAINFLRVSVFPLPTVAEVIAKRMSFILTANAVTTLRISKAISAALEPVKVCASSNKIHRNAPSDFSSIGTSAFLTSMYSNIVGFVNSI